MRARGRAGVLAQRQPMSLAAFVEEGERAREPVRAVRRSHDRQGDLPRRPLSRHPPPRRPGSTTSTSTWRYNPTCAYNATYECPYPPPSNRLKVEIRAGEKAPGRVTAAPCRRSSSTSTGDSRQRAAALPRLSAGARRRRPRAVAEGYYARYLGYDDVGMFQALARTTACAMDGARVTALVAAQGAASCRRCCTAGAVLFPGAIDFIRDGGGARCRSPSRLARCATRSTR